jgi:hypothetical protein
MSELSESVLWSDIEFKIPDSTRCPCCCEKRQKLFRYGVLNELSDLELSLLDKREKIILDITDCVSEINKFEHTKKILQELINLETSSENTLYNEIMNKIKVTNNKLELEKIEFIKINSRLSFLDDLLQPLEIRANMSIRSHIDLINSRLNEDSDEEDEDNFDDIGSTTSTIPTEV